MIKIATTMDKETNDALHAYSQLTGVPIAEVIRRSVRMYLREMAENKVGKEGSK